jgi:hypothetical protein
MHSIAIALFGAPLKGELLLPAQDYDGATQQRASVGPNGCCPVLARVRTLSVHENDTSNVSSLSPGIPKRPRVVGYEGEHRVTRRVA